MRREPVRRSAHALGFVVIAMLATASTTIFTGVPTASGAVSATAPWTPMTTPDVLGPNEVFFDGSCPTVSFCVAVGGITEVGTNTAALADVWKGSGSWKTTSIAAPKYDAGTTREANFSDVSCSSPTYCMAVGQATAPWLVELWNGTKWSLTTEPSALSGQQVLFGSVSCVSSNCVALGAGRTFVWNGSSWTVASSQPPGIGTHLSCFAVEQCLAVGGSSSLASAAYFDDGTWTDEPPPQSAPSEFGSNTFDGVSCTAATPVSCMAVGQVQQPNSPFAPLADAWDATTESWTATTPATSGGQTANLQDVSCSTSTWCVAVGPTTEAWNGSDWTVMDTSRLVSNSAPWGLNGVACPTTSFCVAVGGKPVKTGPTTGNRAVAAYWGTLP